MEDHLPIPYSFVAIPHEFLTEEFVNDSDMIRFIIWMMKRIRYRPTRIPLKELKRHLELEPFEFMFGRFKCSEGAGISSKVARTRLSQLVGLGYVEEVVSKRASIRAFKLITSKTSSLATSEKRKKKQTLKRNL